MLLITLTQKSVEVWLHNKCHKIYLSGPLRDVLSFRYPNYFVLAGANNRNVIITYRFLAAPVQANRVFFTILTVLVIVDTTAAPLCILSFNSILARCVALWNIPIHGKIFTWLIFHTIGEINTGNARFQAQFQVDLHSFDQNIFSFQNSLF